MSSPLLSLTPPRFLSPSLPVGASPVDPSLTHRIPLISWLLGVCLPSHVLAACLALRQERAMVVWPADMLMHRFIARLNEGAASGLYRVTPAALHQLQWVIGKIVWCLKSLLLKHKITFWKKLFDSKSTSFAVCHADLKKLDGEKRI